MATSPSSTIRALLGGGADGDRVASSHFLVGALFLVLGGLLELLALFTLRFADISPVSFGRIEPMANLALMIGFGVITLVGGIYYVLPRLTGTRLWSADLAKRGLLLLSGLVVAGLALVGFGLGSGRPPFGVPWWLDIPMLLALAIPTVVTMGTIANRHEKRSFVTLWFIIGGTVWLPLLYLAFLAGHLPSVGSVGRAYSDLFFSAGFVTMFLFTVGSGLFYYTLVKEVDVPLASRQLASVGFWSLGFAGVWWGVSQLVFGPGPGWIDGIAAAFGLAFPIGTLANAANVSLTLEGHWEKLRDKPGVSSGVIGLYMAVGIALMASLAGFPSIGAVTALTGYWEAIEYAALLGVGTLLAAGIVFEALPRVAGRRMPTNNRARSFIRLTVVGVGGVLVTLAAAGIVSGQSWLAGSNSAAYIDAGDGWAAGAQASEALLLVALGFAVVAFLGQLAYASTVVGTLLTGKAVEQEVLVEKVTSDE